MFMIKLGSWKGTLMAGGAVFSMKSQQQKSLSGVVLEPSEYQCRLIESKTQTALVQLGRKDSIR